MRRRLVGVSIPALDGMRRGGPFGRDDTAKNIDADLVKEAAQLVGEIAPGVSVKPGR